MEPNFYDHLGWSSDKSILSIIGKEIIYYSNKVYKYNSLSMKQERSLLLTDQCLYNIEKKKVKRMMRYKEMLGITFSNHSNEFVVHALEGFDFHFVSEEKLVIIYIIAKCYEIILNESIIICEVKEKSLKQYITAKKFKKKDNKTTKLDKKYAIDTRTFIEDNPPPKINKRSYTEFDAKGILSEFEEGPKLFKNELIFSTDLKIKFINLSDFIIKAVIGKGSVSKVLLSLCEKNEKYYALKYISIDNLNLNNNYDPKNLKNFFVKLYFHFLINVEFCFQTNEKIYFSFPYIKGESLYSYIKKENSLNEEKVKFYASIIALTIKYFHTYGIYNKNFSSKNILIDKDGYLKIVPFHIGMILPLKKKTSFYEKLKYKYFNEYSPPEIIISGQTNQKVGDWWNLGILIFEMIYSVPPFYSDNSTELINMICNKELKFPKNPKISETCKDLINRLLNKKYNERLGFSNDFEEIKKHEFFKNINFSELLNKKKESPYKSLIDDKLKDSNKMFTLDDLIKIGVMNS